MRNWRTVVVFVTRLVTGINLVVENLMSGPWACEDNIPRFRGPYKIFGFKGCWYMWTEQRGWFLFQVRTSKRNEWKNEKSHVSLISFELKSLKWNQQTFPDLFLLLNSTAVLFFSRNLRNACLKSETKVSSATLPLINYLHTQCKVILNELRDFLLLSNKKENRLRNRIFS